jgi:GntR family transcriptional repressor for pyruvate dehydrogenase complex
MTNTAAYTLVQYIVSNELQIGAKLPSIRELATLLNCNKSQVRTGLITLAALGVIDMHPRAGAFVKKLAPGDLDTLFLLFFRFGMPGEHSDIINIYSVKTILDKEIFMCAAKYRTEGDLYKLEQNLAGQVLLFGDNEAYVDADEEFHRHLAQITRNPLLNFFQESVLVMLRPYRIKNLTPEGNEESYRSHTAIFEAIRAQDTAEAERLATQHTMRRLRLLNEEKKDSGAGAVRTDERSVVSARF